MSSKFDGGWHSGRELTHSSRICGIRQERVGHMSKSADIYYGDSTEYTICSTYRKNLLDEVTILRGLLEAHGRGTATVEEGLHLARVIDPLALKEVQQQRLEKTRAAQDHCSMHELRGT